MHTSPSLEPHRVLFPIGALFALFGAILWPAHAGGLTGWPGELHARLMVQGFELAFVAGFLLTFLPRVTRTVEHARPHDTILLVVCLTVFATAASPGAAAVAQGAFVAGILTLIVALAARFRRRANDPPEEFVFIPLGLLLGLAGGLLQLAASLGLVVEPAPRLGLRLVSLGMVLSLVLGVGAILVPTFVGIKNPLVIPGVAAPHARSGRRVLHAILALALVGAFVLEARGDARAGAILRAGVALAMLLWVWKIWNLPTRAGRTGWILWSAGWLVGAGLVAMAAWPAHTIGWMHLTLLGGYGLLTMGIGTRVLVTHGGHGVEAEGAIVDPTVLAGLAIALVARIAAEYAGEGMVTWLAVSGGAWCLAWAVWLARAWPRLRTQG